MHFAIKDNLNFA